MNKWIETITAVPPKDEQKCLVVMDGHVMVMYWQANKNNWFERAGIGPLYHDVNRVPYWMAFPDAPTDIIKGLKPCPFCGGEGKATTVENYSGQYQVYHKYHGVVCEGCRCQTTQHWDKEDAIKAWNQRRTT